MNRVLVLLCCAFLWSTLTGCQSTGKGVEVVVDGDGQFPQFLTGTWKADKHSWEFVFEPDGTISSAVISMGQIELKPGQVTKLPMRYGGKGIFKPGVWTVHYNPANRVLTVEISLKSFYMELGRGILEGESTDIFVGPISEDGKIWRVDWTSFPDYTARTAKYPDFKLTEDPNYGVLKTLILEKITTD